MSACWMLLGGDESYGIPKKCALLRPGVAIETINSSIFLPLDWGPPERGTGHLRKRSLNYSIAFGRIQRNSFLLKLF